MTCGPSYLRSWQRDSSTNRMYGSAPHDALHAEIMQNLFKMISNLQRYTIGNMKLAYISFPYMESQRKFLFIDTSFTRKAPSLEHQQRETK